MTRQNDGERAQRRGPDAVWAVRGERRLGRSFGFLGMLFHIVQARLQQGFLLVAERVVGIQPSATVHLGEMVADFEPLCLRQLGQFGQNFAFAHELNIGSGAVRCHFRTGVGGLDQAMCGTTKGWR